MKVIILSAGTGTRLKLNLPKSLVQVNNKKMVDIQIGILNSIGIDMDKITVVTGYKSNLFSQYEFNKVLNKNYSTTGQLYSISCAGDLATEKEVMIIYGDVLFEAVLIDDLINSKHDFIVPSYVNFKNLWEERGDYQFEDLETFSVNKNGRVLEIGNKVKDIKSVHGQFMGIVYMNNFMFKKFLDHYEGYKKEFSEKISTQLQTTTFLNYLIRKQIQIQSLDYYGYFMELDNEYDLKIIQNSEDFLSSI